MDRTTEAVTRQMKAMGSNVFEVGLFKPEASGEPVMLPRTWDADALVRSVPWLRHQNRNGRNIYIRPAGENNLSLVDDLTQRAVTEMKQSGFQPALVVETSPGNFQAWVKHPEFLPKEISTAAARALASRFGGDPGAADWRHFGRLAGLTNRKQRHMNTATGLFPFVRITEASGNSYPQALPFLSGVKNAVEKEQSERQARSRQRPHVVPNVANLKTIDEFRNNAKYGADATRVDLAYALYALLRGANEADVRAAIGARDLSHKGNERRQQDYVDRTIRKASELAQSRGR